MKAITLIACRTNERIDLIDLAYHLCSAFGWQVLFLLDDRKLVGFDSGLSHFASVGIGVQPVTRSPYRFFA